LAFADDGSLGPAPGVKRPDGVSWPDVVVVSVSAGAGSVVVDVDGALVVVPERPSSVGGVVGAVVVVTGGFGRGLPVLVGLGVLVRSVSVVGVVVAVVVPGVVVVVVAGAGDCVVVVVAPVMGDSVTDDDEVPEEGGAGFVVGASVVDSATAIAADAQ